MTTATTQGERISLYFRQGSSDKEYHASIEPQGTGFVVNFAYGRRGSTLQTGCKTSTPVEYAAAKRIYAKLVGEKTAKGYTPGTEGTPYQQTDRQDRATGILPQLLNPVDEAELGKLLADPAWWAQEKLDGRRLLINRSDDQVTGINRKGLIVALPQPIQDHARRLGCQQWLIDGEAIGDTLYAFDLLEWACNDLRGQPYAKRLRLLDQVLAPAPGNAGDSTGGMRGIETAMTLRAKRALLARLRQEKKEGIVFKRHDAPYTPGRPTSGGGVPQVKVKFTATASCVVAKVNAGKRSVKLELLDPCGNRVGVGNVTVPANQVIPGVGSIVEVRYLYAYPGGALYQPVLLGLRDDLDLSACVTRQLKIKAGESGDEQGEG